MKTKPKAPEQKRLPNWLIVSSVLIGAVLLTWMTSNVNRSSYIQKEREGFEKAEAAATATIDELRREIGEPLYVDTNNFCHLRAPGKFADKKLFCHTKSAAYFQQSSDPSNKTLLFAKQAVESHYSTRLEQTSYINESGFTEYINLSSTAKEMNGLECSVSIKSPSNGWGSSDLPSRTFSNEVTILRIISDCEMSVREAIY